MLCMRLFRNLILVVLVLISCNSFIKKKTNNELYSFAFKNFEIENKLELIDLDSIKTYSELIEEMERIDCSGKISGLKFKYEETNYNIVGYAYCPDIDDTACYFSPNIFTVKNDSLISRFKEIKNKPIEYLKTKLDTIITKKYNFHYKQNKVKPAIIHFHLEDKYSISMVKKVLKEIAESFKKINRNKSPDFFEYDILFEGFSISDIPHPPPPNDNNIK